MARQQPKPEPIPADGGSYLLDPATGQWIDQDHKPAECVMPTPQPAESDEVNP